MLGLKTVYSSGSTRPAHDCLAQAPGGAHHDHFGEAALRVQGEDHSGAGEVGADHELDTDGQGDCEVVEAHTLPIINGAIGEERRETASARIKKLAGSTDVQIRLLLAGEARLGKVFGRGATTHGHLGILAITGAPELLVRGDDLGLKRVGQRLRKHQRPN